MRRPPASASELAQARLGAMTADLEALTLRRYTADDVADRGLARSLIEDVRHGLDVLEERLGLPGKIEKESDGRLRALRRG